MKKIFLFAVVISTGSFAQVTFGNGTNLGTVLFKDKVFDMENKNKDIQGSAYIYQDFVSANIKDVEGNLKVRYNALKDDVEIKQNDAVYIIPREERFSTITIMDNGEIIKLEKFTYKDKPYEGYLFVINENNGLTVYKKEKVEFKDFEKPRNSYDEEKPARFIPEKTEYFIKDYNGKIFELPKNKKKLIERLPEKGSKIEAFLKNNKIDFNNEKDLKKLFSNI